jgi:integrase
MRFLDVDELCRLASAMDLRYRGLVLLGGYGGLRVGEMLALRWDHVDLKSRRVNVVETLTDLASAVSFGPPKTTAAVGSLAVPRFVTDELAHLRARATSHDELVFVRPLGDQLVALESSRLGQEECHQLAARNHPARNKRTRRSPPTRT